MLTEREPKWEDFSFSHVEPWTSHAHLPNLAFTRVTQTMLEGYCDLIEAGMPESSIAHAMLGATLHLYDAFDLTGPLPALLRATADRLEQRSALT